MTYFDNWFPQFLVFLYSMQLYVFYTKFSQPSTTVPKPAGDSLAVAFLILSRTSNSTIILPVSGKENKPQANKNKK